MTLLNTLKLFCFSFLDGFLSLFDPFPFKKIKASSGIEEVPVTSYAECAERCLDSGTLCFAFDVTDEGGDLTCTLARTIYDVEESFGNFDVMHFEIEKMPCKFVKVTYFCNKMDTPQTLWYNSAP